MRKVFIILVFLVLVRCTVSLISVKHSNDVRIEKRLDTDFDSETSADIDLIKKRDSLKRDSINKQ